MSDEQTVTDSPDLLNRLQDVRNVEQFLKSQKGRKGCVLNVDAGWGLGKTFFLDMLKKKLGLHAVYVNAWESDYADDALLPVLAAVTKGLKELSPEKQVAKVKRIGSKLAFSLGAGAIRGGIGVLTSGASEGVWRIGSAAMERAMSDQADALFERFAASEQTIAEFKKEIEEAVADLDPDKPFTILIDELDRCRPTYAIEILERIKHLFDIPNVVFVVATDTEQLQHAIKAVYGEGFDAKAYLRRFFTRTYRFDVPDKGAYIVNGLAQRNVSFGAIRAIGNIQPVDLIEAVALGCELSFRDLNQCLDQIADMHAESNSNLYLSFDLAIVLVVLHQQGNLDLFERIARGDRSEETLTALHDQFQNVDYEFPENQMRWRNDPDFMRRHSSIGFNWQHFIVAVFTDYGAWRSSLTKLKDQTDYEQLDRYISSKLQNFPNLDHIKYVASAVRRIGRFSEE